MEVFGITWAGSQLTKVQHLLFTFNGLIKSYLFMYEVLKLYLSPLKILQPHRPFGTTGSFGILAEADEHVSMLEYFTVLVGRR